jgi:hypothetical protein
MAGEGPALLPSMRLNRMRERLLGGRSRSSPQLDQIGVRSGNAGHVGTMFRRIHMPIGEFINRFPPLSGGEASQFLFSFVQIPGHGRLMHCHPVLLRAALRATTRV